MLSYRSILRGEEEGRRKEKMQNIQSEKEMNHVSSQI